MRLLLLSCLAVCACEEQKRPAPAVVASVAAPMPGGSASPVASRMPRPPFPARTLERLGLDSEGRFVAELARPGKPRALVVLSTREAPLAPRSPAAHHNLAELVAPGITPKTELVALQLAELVAAADGPRTQRALRTKARVLANGAVLAALVIAPAARGKPVNLADLTEGRTAWSWEAKLVTKEPPAEEFARLLASYQTLLAIDYLTGNLARREVLHDADGQAVVAVWNNEVFSRPVDDAVGDSWKRLAGHLVFSKKLAQSVKALDEARVGRALRGGPEAELLVTPKQVEEVLERKRALEKLFATRVKQRGEERALALP